MKIQITLDVDDEIADPADDTGLTEEGHDEVFEAVAQFGSNVEIKRAP